MRQVDTPVLPDVATWGFHIFVWVALFVEVVAVRLVEIIQEVGRADTDEVELRLGSEERLHIRVELLIAAELIRMRLPVHCVIEGCGCREEANVPKVSGYINVVLKV